MIRRIALVIGAAVCAFAQPPTQKMLDSSVQVIGAIQKDGKLAVGWLGGGFAADARHVVTVGACCDKTQEGVQKTPFVRVNGKVIDTKVAWTGPADIVILEVEQPLNGPPITISGQRLLQKNQPVYTVQFPQKGDPSVTEGQYQNVVTSDKIPVAAIKTTPTADSVDMGGAMFDSCGSVIGINLLVDKGAQYAFVIDPVAGGFQKTGVQVSVANGACAAGGGQTRSDAPKGQNDDPNRWRLPKGNEWIGFAALAGVALLAFRRSTRQQVARVLTARRVPAAPPPPPPAALTFKPVLHGLAGQYAGASFPLEGAGTTLGRDAHIVNLVFSSEADSISKRHCSIRWEGARGVFVIEDLGSTNGTFLDSGERLPPGEARDMHSGESFYIGDLRNQFEVRMEESPQV